MAEKKVSKIVRLQIQAGKANPAPPIGPVLGQTGINIQQFCMQYNERTKAMMGNVVPVVITVFEDRSFTFITKTPPASDMLKKAAGVQSGAHNNKTETAGTVTKDQVREIATTKLPDLSAYDVDHAMKIIEGTARNMGIKVQ